MVRNIVGTLVDIGLRTLAAGRDRRHPGVAAIALAAGRTAPPQGLFLIAVRYGARTAL